MEFRPLQRSDFEQLAEWLGRPHVASWWREASDLPAVAAAYGPLVDGSDPTEGFILVREGQPVAFLQRYRLDDNPEWQRAIAFALAEGVGVDDRSAGAGDGDEGDPSAAAAGIDYLIGDEAMTGHGLGRQMIAAFVDLSWARYPDITGVVVAVDQANRASWRALEGAGFVRTWAGVLDSDDPSDAWPSYVYMKRRPAG
jgi:aminoglycoside 6'-N-acetyltransferase